MTSNTPPEKKPTPFIVNLCTSLIFIAGTLCVIAVMVVFAWWWIERLVF